MSAQLISIYALGAMFVVATLLPVNMGVLAFVGAFLVGTLVAGLATKDIIAGFPAGLFLTLVGITYLFAIAQNNGTINWLVQLAVRAVRGHVAAIPWIMFALAAVLTAVGAVSPAAVAIIAPIALGFAMQHKISPLLMGLMVIHGAQAGGFSPISRSEEHTSELQSLAYLVCRLLLEKKKKKGLGALRYGRRARGNRNLVAAADRRAAVSRPDPAQDRRLLARAVSVRQLHSGR